MPLRDAFQAAQAGATGDEAAAPELGLSEEVFSEQPSPGGIEITDEDLAAAHAAVEAEAAAAAEAAATAEEPDPAELAEDAATEPPEDEIGIAPEPEADAAEQPDES